jgi:DNA mismatch repair protein MutH
MLIISHRGNLEGPDPELENRPEQIDLAISKGFLVEVDLNTDRGWLGHCRPTYHVGLNWLLHRKDHLIIHLKDAVAINRLFSLGFHFFAHDKDPFVVTNRGLVWTTSDIHASLGKGIWVINERKEKVSESSLLTGICTDYPLYYAKNSHNNSV